MEIQKALSIRDGFGEGLFALAQENAQVVVLTADLAESTRVQTIAKHLPQQFVECGVAEQNMLGVAAGMSMAGKIPFITSFAVFSPGRNWDQLRISACYSNTNVKVVGHHAGFSADGDGATHQALEDIAITRVLPNLVVLCPCDYYEAYNCVEVAANHLGPVYIRISKTAVTPITKPTQPFVIGKGEMLKSGKDLTLITTGVMTAPCLEAAHRVQADSDIEVLTLSTIKPLDTKLILQSVQKTGKVLTVEDHQVAGGLGSAVAEVLASELPVRVVLHGVYDTFGESGSYADLLEKYELDTNGIVQKIQSVMKL